MGFQEGLPSDISKIALNWRRNDGGTYGEVPPGTPEGLFFQTEDLATDEARVEFKIASEDGSPSALRFIPTGGQGKSLKLLMAPESPAPGPKPALTQFLEMLLMSEQVDRSVTGVTLSFDAGENAVLDSANGLGGTRKGCMVLISGAAETSNNTMGRVASVEPGKIVLEACVLATEAAGETVTIHQHTIDTGQALIDAAIERHHTDYAGDEAGYQMFPGVVAMSGQVGWAKNDAITLDLTVGHAGTGEQTDATGFDAPPTPGPDVLDFLCMATDIRSVYINKVEKTSVESFSVTLDNGIEPIGPSGVPCGWAPKSDSTKTAKGKMKFLLFPKDTAIRSIMNTHEAVPIEFVLSVPGGGGTFILTIHQAVFTNRAEITKNSRAGAGMIEPEFEAVFPKEAANLVTITMFPSLAA